MAVEAHVGALWQGLGLAPEALPPLDLSGAEPVLPTSFRVGEAAQAAIALAGASAAALHAARGGRPQRVAVVMAHAAAEFRSERFLSIDGGPPAELWDPIAGLYPTGDGGWVRLHTNFPHHRDGMLALLHCANERDAVAEALMGWRAMDLEAAAAEAGMVASALRTFQDWDAHPQAAALRAAPVIELTRLDDAPPTPLPPAAERPLGGLRLLDLTRVIAGPVAGRALAAHGADVLRVTSPRLPDLPALDIDTGRGKRSAQLDLDRPADADRLHALAGEADVFLQAYRPGALAARGFGAETLAARRPGLVHAELDAYGFDGPWAGRRGFDSLVQTATGFNHAEADALGREKPTALPAQALDHASGYFLTAGILAALIRRAREGGSWRVRVSLARTGHWLRDLGRIDAATARRTPDPTSADAAPWLEETGSPFGRLRALSHAAKLSETPAHRACPPVPLDHDTAEWPPR